MMGSLKSFRIVALFLLVQVCAGQLLLRFTNDETAVVNCGPIILQWRGGRAPYTLSATEDVLIGGKVLQDIGRTNNNAARWNVELPADVTSVQVTLTDSLGNAALPKVFRVATGRDTSCIPQTGLPDPSASLPVSESNTSASSVSTDSASASASSVASVPSDTASSVNPTSQSTPPPTPTSPPVNPQQTTVIGITTTPSASAGANNATGAQQTSNNLPTIAIVGIVAGSIVGLIAVAFLIFCYVKRIRTKSDPLDTWDGGYDPDAVFKVTNQYGGANNFSSPDTRVVPDTAPLWDPSTSQVPPQSGWNNGNAPPQNTAYGQTMYSNGAQYQYR